MGFTNLIMFFSYLKRVYEDYDLSSSNENDREKLEKDRANLMNSNNPR